MASVNHSTSSINRAATSKLERVKENTAAADGPVLPQDVLRRLEAMCR